MRDRPTPAEELSSNKWLAAFVCIEIACQLVLLVVDQHLLRLPLRVAAYSASLAFAFLLPNRTRAHPAAGVAALVIGIYCLSLFHVDTRWPAGLAQVALSAAVLAPLFWAPRLLIHPAALTRLLAAVWVFNVASAALGVLQVAYPGRFEPMPSEALVQMRGSNLAKTYAIRNTKGEEAQRPMGLTDTPGGAATHGAFAVLIGLAGWLTARRWAIKLTALAGITVGLSVVFLSQARVFTVMLAVSVLTLLLVMFVRNERRRVLSLAVMIAILAALGFELAYAVGGETMSGRLHTLVADKPSEVYYSNRGHFVESTFEQDLPRYWFGAGLGRWGMANFYLAGKDDPARPNLWAEVQWTAWVYDGGLPLIVAYPVLILIACWELWKMTGARRPDELRVAAAVVLGYTVGSFAATFCSPIFHSQMGMDVWMLNGALFAANACSEAQGFMSGSHPAHRFLALSDTPPV